MVQDILEECCFNFGCLWLPEVLKARSCECVESIELTRWTRILFRHYKDLPPLATTEIPGVTFREVLFRTHQIRHTAVHRRLASVSEIEKMIENAVSLTIVLKDALQTRKIETIQREAEVKIEELRRVQNELEVRMSAELAMIAQRRKLLDEFEKKAIDLTLSEGNQNRLRVGSGLDGFLIKGQKCTESGVQHPEKMRHAKGDDAPLKLEDLEGTISSTAGRTTTEQDTP